MIESYLAEWQDQGSFWAKETDGTRAQAMQADLLFPQVVERLHQQGELELHSARRIWDYCVGDFGPDPVSEITDEL